MKFSLTMTTILFCATASFALPGAAEQNDIAVDSAEGIDPPDIEVVDIEYNADDFDELVTRGTIRCSNQGRIKRFKKEYDGKCSPSNSRGFLSAHNCKNKDGKSYLCVQNRRATCYSTNMQSHTLSDASPLPRHMFWSFINTHEFDEIPNYPGAVRQYISNHAVTAHQKTEPGKATQSIFFCVYQRERYGPQNGYRFCVVHEGYYVGPAEKMDGDPEDDIDKLEKDIPQGHEEMVVLGEPRLFADPGKESE
ncbi:unnamed protein product, partial [Clonostachys solani]